MREAARRGANVVLPPELFEGPYFCSKEKDEFFAWAKPADSHPTIARFSDLASTNDITADTRVQLWRDTTPLVRDYLWSGCGFGAYESCFLKYKSVAPMNTADFAHNDYLQALAELGVFGFAAGVAFVLLILAGAGRRILYPRSADERYRAIACVAAMTAMLAHSFVDFNMYVPANALTFAWIAGIANCAPGAEAMPAFTPSSRRRTSALEPTWQAKAHSTLADAAGG